MERSVAEAETLRLGLSKETHHQIDALYVVVIDAPNFLSPLWMLGRYQLLKALHWIEMD